MTTNAITANPAAAVAAQTEANQASRAQAEAKRPPVAEARESHSSSRYAERKAARDDGRGQRVDIDA